MAVDALTPPGCARSVLKRWQRQNNYWPEWLNEACNRAFPWFTG